jgi:hypothetical protein
MLFNLTHFFLTACVLKGGWVSSINRWAFEYSTLLPIFNFFKRPLPLSTATNVFEPLNNSSYNLIESRDQRSKIHKSGWFFVSIFFNTGCNLFRSRIFLMRFSWILNAGGGATMYILLFADFFTHIIRIK